MISEITIKNEIQATKYYIWGQDLIGSLQEAAGIAGLMASLDSSSGNTYHYSYDVNGNVGQLVNAANGEITAHLEYDPFGNQIVAMGNAAVGNPFRYSTKYFDEEIGLYYYGYRYYSPRLGRWLTRDPIEEEGGLNLYDSYSNDPINSIDYLGYLIISFKLKWDDNSELENMQPHSWRKGLELERTWKDLGAGPKLGLHIGKGYVPTSISEICRLYGICKNKGEPIAIGLWKFEAKIIWCGSTKWEDRPIFIHYVRNLKTWEVNKQTREYTILVDKPSERQDGYMSSLIGIDEKYKVKEGYMAFGYDAPRTGSRELNQPAKNRHYFQSEWRVTAEDKDSFWETEIGLGFSFDDDGNPNSFGAGSFFSIISEPRRLR